MVIMCVMRLTGCVSVSRPADSELGTWPASVTADPSPPRREPGTLRRLAAPMVYPPAPSCVVSVVSNATQLRLGRTTYNVRASRDRDRSRASPVLRRYPGVVASRTPMSDASFSLEPDSDWGSAVIMGTMPVIGRLRFNWNRDRHVPLTRLRDWSRDLHGPWAGPTEPCICVDMRWGRSGDESPFHVRVGGYHNDHA